MEFIQIFSTCSSSNEAENISKLLLEKKLVACIKQSKVATGYLWEGECESDNEVLLIMESIQANFDRVVKEIEAIHSYSTPVIYATSVSNASQKTKRWLENVLS